MNNKFTNLRIALKIFSFIPLIAFSGILLMILAGILLLGHVPRYGVDPDPFTLNLDIFGLILICSFTLSIFIIPFWILIFVHLVINRYPFSKSEYFSLISMLLGVLFFVVLKIGQPNILEWVLD
ncbi:MAG: hypothetical protein ACXWDO_05825 [Bacteroidia bacterium]